LRGLPNKITFKKITIPESPFYLIVFPDYAMQIHVISFAEYTIEKPIPTFLYELSQHFHAVQTIHLWEDQWYTKNSIIKNRILSKLGVSNRIHGRKTEVRRIDKFIAEGFMQVQHLQGYATGYYKYGLYEKNTIYAIALFSKVRKMRQVNYYSAELIRYANLDGFHVSGGLGKLINHYIQEHGPNDIMTYVDSDWGNGVGYKKLGFETKEITPPQMFWVDPKTNERHFPARFCKENGLDSVLNKSAILKKYELIEIYNSGNIKMIKLC